MLFENFIPVYQVDACLYLLTRRVGGGGGAEPTYQEPWAWFFVSILSLWKTTISLVTKPRAHTWLAALYSCVLCGGVSQAFPLRGTTRLYTPSHVPQGEILKKSPRYCRCRHFKKVWDNILASGFFFTSQFPPCPWTTYKSHFKFLRKFVEIFVSKG